METAYNNILAKSKEKLKENEFNNDKERFNTIAKELTQWCNAIMKRLYAIETPRYVFSVSSNFGFGFGIRNLGISYAAYGIPILVGIIPTWNIFP